MNDFGLIVKNPDVNNLFALPMIFAGVTDLASIEVIYPEWVEGSYYSTYTSAAIETPSTNDKMKRAVVDATDYDFILTGVSLPDSGFGSGTVCAGSRGESGNMTYYSTAKYISCEYVMLPTPTGYKNVYLSQAIEHPLPVIGIRKS